MVTNDDELERPPAERRLLDRMVDERGETYVKEHAERIPVQARVVGEL